MTSEEIARLLHAKKIGRDRWIAKCSAHPDKKPSLAICKGRTGTLLKCLSNGCDVRDITSNIGLRMRDLFYMERDQSSEQLKALSRQRRIDALYELEQQRQDYRMIVRAMQYPPQILLYSYIQDQFTRKIESLCSRLESH